MYESFQAAAALCKGPPLTAIESEDSGSATWVNSGLFSGGLPPKKRRPSVKSNTLGLPAVMPKLSKQLTDMLTHDLVTLPEVEDPSGPLALRAYELSAEDSGALCEDVVARKGKAAALIKELDKRAAFMRILPGSCRKRPAL